MRTRLQPQQRGSLAFLIGCIVIFAGGALHLPMLVMAHEMGNRLVGMPMDQPMYVGMVLIAVGVPLAIFGALSTRERVKELDSSVRFEISDDTPLTARHFLVLAVLSVALVIDLMKPATLSFVLPGVRNEYGLDKATTALLPFSALSGTTVGSFLWGWIADRYGRRISILLAAVLFVATSVCGAMPTFAWNLVMCFLMGCSAGGMLPVVYSLVAEIVPTKSRGLALVLVGGLGAVGGYLAASLAAQMLEPTYGWRVLWLLGFPTGLILLIFARIIPESPGFLHAKGRVDELDKMAKKYGIVQVQGQRAAGRDPSLARSSPWLTWTLVLTALTWSTINFGLLLWLPSELATRGYEAGTASGLLARSALFALPTIIVVSLLYSRWSSKWTLVVTMALTVAGLVGTALPSEILADRTSLIVVMAVLLVGTNGMIVVLMPYVAESYATAVRGRATGLVAGSSKLGGVAIQVFAMGGLVPGLAIASWILIVPMLLAIILVGLLGHETRGAALKQGFV
jgi:putative MFS transporter